MGHLMALALKTYQAGSQESLFRIISFLCDLKALQCLSWGVAIGPGNLCPLMRNAATSELFLFYYSFLPCPVTASRMKRSNGTSLAKRIDLGVGDEFQ